MIPTLLRCLLPFTFAILIVACSGLPKLPGTGTPADVLFLQALDEMSADAPGTAFDTLQRDYPDSPWAASARSINELHHTRDIQETRIRGLQQENNRLLQANRKLKEDLENLKKLVIETEMRRR